MQDIFHESHSIFGGDLDQDDSWMQETYSRLQELIWPKLYSVKY